jgi:opacity protein-like surface antigen
VSYNTIYNFDNKKVGMVVGFGVEHKFNPATSLKIEWTHTMIPTAKGDYIGAQTETYCQTYAGGCQAAVDARFDAVTVGLNWYFGK